MRKEEIRIAIAEVCGWKKDIDWEVNHRWDHDDFYSSRGVDELPGYEQDLNAMHEAEKTLSLTQLTDYGCELVNLVEHKSNLNTPHWGRIAIASASQRAEAFLRTLGLWKEEA